MTATITTKAEPEVEEAIKPVRKYMGRPKKTAYVKKVESDVKDIYGLLSRMSEEIKIMQETLTGEVNPQIVKVDSVQPKVKDETKTNYPVPEDYRKAVDVILNQDFGVIVEPCKDSPEFNFVIVVPQKYSSFTLEEAKIKAVDLRSKNISYAEKTNGVKQWAEKVYNSFNLEVRAQIVSDRKLT